MAQRNRRRATRDSQGHIAAQRADGSRSYRNQRNSYNRGTRGGVTRSNRKSGKTVYLGSSNTARVPRNVRRGLGL